MEAGILANVTDLNSNEKNADDNDVVSTTELPPEPRKQRERRQKSPNTTSMLLALVDPSIASSSSTSIQQIANDKTFEPTIDMMVNDFDDEQTLNEEEALAASEQQDPQDEIATLREESEMPLEELLAKYQSLSRSPLSFVAARKKKRQHKKLKTKQNKESNIEKIDLNEESQINENTSETVEDILDLCVNEVNGVEEIKKIDEKDITPKRSYLLDLYPDQNFNASKITENCDLPLEAIYGDGDGDGDDDGDDEDDEDEDEAEDIDGDYVKKTIMVGSAYQATIPVGLSQYGDILPYENEDKLIWEPSQVSEREVEEYLLMARDIKPTLCEDELNLDAKTNDAENNNAANITKNSDEINTQTFVKVLNGHFEHENNASVVKDNEQALHLLVQCGYDFKEALRRKRLNAVPLTGSMSIWSEEECQKFEEGIQKFGKDFLSIRQNQVRSRSMRELVLFYYLWKKSERRDHEFANTDTVDHMDIYLNESGDYNAANTTALAAAQNLPIINARARSNSTGSNTQKNISIMAVSQSNLTNALKTAVNRKRTATPHNDNDAQ